MSKQTMPRPDDPSDEQLVAAARAGDRLAFGVVVERYGDVVTALARAITGSPTQGEEIAQETFLLAWTRLGTMREPERLRAWLCGIARFVSQRSRFEQLRNLPAGFVPAGRDVASDDPSPLERIINGEEERVLASALAEIPEAYRVPLILLYREQQSMEQIGEALGLSPLNVKKRLWRGRRKLRGSVLGLLESSLVRTKAPAGLVAAVAAAVSSVPAARAASQRDRPLARSSRAAKSVAVVVASAGLLALGYIGVGRSSDGRLAALGLTRPALPGPPRPEPRAVVPLPRLLPSGALPANGPQAVLPALSRPTVAFNFDFENGVVPPGFQQGYVVPAPKGSFGRHAMIGTLSATWPTTYQVVVAGDEPALFSYSDSGVLSFDYRIGDDYRVPGTDGQINALSVSLGNISQGKKFVVYLHDYEAGTWAHAELPLATFREPRLPSSRQEEGERIGWITILAGKPGGEPFFIDNIKLTTNQQAFRQLH